MKKLLFAMTQVIVLASFAEAQDPGFQSLGAQNPGAQSLDYPYPGLVHLMEALPIVSFLHSLLF